MDNVMTDVVVQTPIASFTHANPYQKAGIP